MEFFKEFDDYVSNYDFNNENIKLKYYHSYRVMKLSEKYSKILHFTEDDILLARLIGLIHDIGRFPQYEIYKTFYDKKSVDHATLGNKVLFDEHFIERFTDNYNDYDVIRYAIDNHNKFELEKTNDERALLHGKLIRDTDKIDILFLKHFFCDKISLGKDNVSQSVINSIVKHKPVLIENVKNSNDVMALYFAFAFDINNDCTLDEVRKNVEKLYEKMEDKDIFYEIYNEVINYIDEREDKNVKHKIRSLKC